MTKNTLKHRSKKAEEKALEGENKLLTLWEKENHWLRYSEIVKAMKQEAVVRVSVHLPCLLGYLVSLRSGGTKPLIEDSNVIIVETHHPARNT